MPNSTIKDRNTTDVEWRAEGRELFGEDTSQWRFVCPVCGHVAKVQDWLDAGATEGQAGYSCVGRYIEGARGAMTEDGPGPCNYAGGGLFRLNPVRVFEANADQDSADPVCCMFEYDGRSPD